MPSPMYPLLFPFNFFILEWRVIIQLPYYAEKQFLKAEHVPLHVNCMSPGPSLLKLRNCQDTIDTRCFCDCAQSVFCIPGERNTPHRSVRLSSVLLDLSEEGKGQIWLSRLNGFLWNHQLKHKTQFVSSDNPPAPKVRLFHLTEKIPLVQCCHFMESLQLLNSISVCPQIPIFLEWVFLIDEQHEAPKSNFSCLCSRFSLSASLLWLSN